MAANQSITVNVGALSNAIAVAIQQATTDSDARGSASGGAAAVPVAPSSSIGICGSLLNCNSNGIRQSAHIDGDGLVGCHCTSLVPRPFSYAHAREGPWKRTSKKGLGTRLPLHRRSFLVLELAPAMRQ